MSSICRHEFKSPAASCSMNRVRTFLDATFCGTCRRSNVTRRIYTCLAVKRRSMQPETYTFFYHLQSFISFLLLKLPWCFIDSESLASSISSSYKFANASANPARRIVTFCLSDGSMCKQGSRTFNCIALAQLFLSLHEQFRENIFSCYVACVLQEVFAEVRLKPYHSFIPLGLFVFTYFSDSFSGYLQSFVFLTLLFPILDFITALLHFCRIIMVVYTCNIIHFTTCSISQRVYFIFFFVLE